MVSSWINAERTSALCTPLSCEFYNFFGKILLAGFANILQKIERKRERAENHEFAISSLLR